MNNYVIVRPEHLNHHGYLFGGMMLKWIDEFAWIGASRDYKGYTLVTIAMDKIQFKERVICGSILRFNIKRVKQGRTSVEYRVDVFADEQGAIKEKKVFSTSITFVSVDEQGKVKLLPVIK